MKRISVALTLALGLVLCGAGPALAETGHYHLDGSALSALWVVPFAGMLLSIAIGPLAVPHFWEHHFGKVAIFWSIVFLAPCFLAFGAGVTMFTALETMLIEYVPFIVLLLALFTIAGGIRLTGTLVGTPAVNTGILAVGAVLASLMGTTGAAMLLIRPLLRANAHRKYRVHTIVFFIFLVANIGGSLTPLGDPPLFLGFLHGVDFFWTAQHLFVKTGFMVLTLLAIYFILDSVLCKKAGHLKPDLEGPQEPFGFLGKVNFILLAGVVGMVLVSGLWQSDIAFPIWGGIELTLPDLMRDLVLLGLAFLSLKLTPYEIRRGNDFTWGPIKEVAKLFAGIFITMVPAITILRAGETGALRDLVALVSANGEPVNHMYFWLTGCLSSFLDNAPTYLVFFNLAGGDAAHLMHEIPTTLAAISAGAVFMGANTYIGNAPNFMVKSIATEQGVKMPSFFGYMAWSMGILVPLFLIVTFVFF